MDILLRRFWLISALWVGGFGSWRLRRITLSNLSQSDRLSQQEVRFFSYVYAIAVGVLSLSFWVLQLSIGPSATPHFSEWPPVQSASAQMLLFHVLLGYWVWLGGGATVTSEVIRLCRPGAPDFLTSPTACKVSNVIATLTCFASLGFS